MDFGHLQAVYKMSDVSVDHIGIATESIEKASEFWELLGFETTSKHVNEDQGVRILMLEGTISTTKLELLEPLTSDTPVGKFISKRGVGIQQLAVKVNDIESTIALLSNNGVRMISDIPVDGVDGTTIAFVHPSSTGGVLVELVEHCN